MDNRTLIAFGMVLGVLALFRGSLTPQDVKEILISIVSGTIGVERGMRARSTDGGKSPPGTTAAVNAAAIIVLAFLIAGCATSEPWTGPVSPPTLTGTEWVWPHGIDGHLRRETVLHVNNSQPTELDAVLDCDPPGHGHRARNWLGSRMTLRVPPMTVQHVLLDPHDHVCQLLPMEE